MALPLEHYGVIGDSTTVALVSRSGSIDWLCLPRFDSDACFARLLGGEEHGHWSIQPSVPIRSVRQRYRHDTLVLETEFVCDGGSARLIDFMPPDTVEHDVVRIVEGIEGEVPFHAELRARFGYGQQRPWLQGHGQQATLTSGPDALVLHSPVLHRAHWDASSLVSEFTIRARTRLPLTLEHFPSHQRPPSRPIDAERALVRTERRWRSWASRCSYHGPWRDAVVRSLITLKALTHEPTGGIVAAPTTSLPEELGGVRNWDYRYCWLRDSALTLDALMLGGYHDEARAWRDWLLRAAAGAPDQAQIMYGVAGEHRLTEIELPWLPGYEGSSPVRIGNGAYLQFQLDVYGETLNTLYASRVLERGKPAPLPWDFITAFVDSAAKDWRLPDEGIWEIRGKEKLHFTHSKLMAWVAFDRGVRFIEEFGDDAPPRTLGRVHEWRALRDAVRQEILERAWNPRVQAFTQAYGSDALDASVLLIPHMGFLPAHDPRMLSTVAAIERELCWDGFVLRYVNDTGVDGLPGHEGTFLLCSFWLVDNYAMSGRLDEAEALLERLLAVRSDLGLLAEEYHPGLRRQLGNYPQAFSHVGLINSAFLIDALRKGREVPFPAATCQLMEAGILP